jgi:peptidoglycan hydrolase-like protein with peptidoglycan-binding domain
VPDVKQGTLHAAPGGGVIGSHPAADPFQFLVAPSTNNEFNTARLRLIPIACFRIDDVRFKFDSSFVLPETQAEMKAFANLRKSDPAVDGAPVSIFGHADPTFQGNFEPGSSTAHSGDDYNKILSGRRAIAIYALLIRDAALWNNLFSNHFGGDVWGEDSIRIILDFTDPVNAGQQVPSGSGSSDPGAAESARKAKVRDIAHDPGRRQQLFLKYMNAVCGDLKLDKAKDFLARGAGPDHKGDVQGCGRFNPVILFSQEDEARFKQADEKGEKDLLLQRNVANAANRRVIILIFRKGSQILPAKWPCPTFKEGSAGCKKRFFSDGEKRRSTHEAGAPRKFSETSDTFACRLFQRISEDSPCQGLRAKIFQVQLRDHDQNPLSNTVVSLTVNGKRTNPSTDDDGFLQFQVVPDAKAVLEVRGETYELTFDDSFPSDVRHAQALLNALGFNAGPIDGILGRRTEDALKSFQRTHDLDPSGKLDQATEDALRDEQIILELNDDGTPLASTAPPKKSPKKKKSSGGAGNSRAAKRPSPAPSPSPSPSPTAAPAPAPASPPAPAPTPTPTPTIIKTDSSSRVDLPPPHDELSQAIIDRFDDIDTDRDGFLSKKEIDVALGKADFSGKHGAMVATIKKFLGDFEEFSDDEIGWENDGITRSDVTAYDRRRTDDPNDKKIKQILNMFAYAKDKIAKSTTDLFVGVPNPLKVHQGMIGDCWFLAAIVAVGLRNPQEIKKMVFKQFETFNVQLPGRAAPLLITRPTDGELAIFSTVDSNGIWLPVLEKSYGEAANRDALFFVDTSTTDAADGGDFLPKGIQLMTGHASDSDTIILTRASKIRSKLIKAFADKKIVTAGIRGAILGSDFRNDGLPMGHAYTVMSYDSSTDTIKLRNPWGNTGPKGVTEVDGAFEMKLEAFESDFSDIAFEE